MRFMKLLGVVFVMVTAAPSFAGSAAASSASFPAAWPGSAVERNDASCEPDFEHPPLCKRRSADIGAGLTAVLQPPALAVAAIGPGADGYQPAQAGSPSLPPFSLASR